MTTCVQRRLKDQRVNELLVLLSARRQTADYPAEGTLKQVARVGKVLDSVLKFGESGMYGRPQLHVLWLANELLLEDCLGKRHAGSVSRRAEVLARAFHRKGEHLISDAAWQSYVAIPVAHDVYQNLSGTRRQHVLGDPNIRVEDHEWPKPGRPSLTQIGRAHV